MSNEQTSTTGRRIAIVGDAKHYVGPDLTRMLAASGHDLVVGDASPELIAQVEGMGASIVSLDRTSNMTRPESAPALAAAALEHFGRIDAAVLASGQIIGGMFVNSSPEQYQTLFEGCMTAPYNFLKAVLPTMIEQRSGQVLVITSASGSRPVFGASLYSSVRAGANMLVRGVAQEVASKNVQVNAVGTNYMDFPEFHAAVGSDDPAVRAEVEKQVPLGRLGQMGEFASFCRVFLDGSSTFTTGQYISYAGGWA
ncbi:MAG: SDR family oxidoreductase [Actinobacteria bacterium]|nr:SDR family oxidoreductase [Actinomycetota bacterium]